MVGTEGISRETLSYETAWEGASQGCWARHRPVFPKLPAHIDKGLGGSLGNGRSEWLSPRMPSVLVTVATSCVDRYSEPHVALAGQRLMISMATTLASTCLPCGASPFTSFPMQCGYQVHSRETHPPTCHLP